MNQDYCLVKNGVIVNIIVADENFISQISSQYDQCFVRTNEGPGWVFNQDTQKYESPVI